MSFPTPNYNIAVLAQSALWMYENNPVLADLQIGVENDTGRFKLGDGVTDWNTLGYAAVSQPTGVWVGRSNTAGNLLELNVLNGGFYVDPTKFDGRLLVNQAADGALTDITPYLTNNQQLAGFVATGLLIRKVIEALGEDWDITSGGATPSPSVSETISNITSTVITLSNALYGMIDDNAPSSLKTYSSTKITQLVTQAIGNIVGAAPEALDTVYELAAALGNNPNLVNNIVTELGKTIKYEAQLLNGAQQWQARTNIGAASAADLGSASENASSLADKYLAEKSLAAGSITLLPDTTPTPLERSTSFTAYPIGMFDEGVYALRSNSGSFNVFMYGGAKTPGAIISFIDQGMALAVNAVTLKPNGGRFMGVEQDYVLNRYMGSRSFIWVSNTWGWHPF